MNKRLAGLTVLLWAATAHAQAREAPDIGAGRRIAQQNCGGCHAVGAGRSALADAPPFRLLYRRYGARTLGDMLQEGMLAPPEPQEEGSPTLHPRMPVVSLDKDQIADLKAYLRSLQPSRRKRGG